MMEMEQLKECIAAMEQEKQELKHMWTYENQPAVGETVSSVTTPGSELVGMVIDETVSVHSMTPECFELIEAEGRNMDVNEGATLGEDDELALSPADTDTEWTRVMLPPVAGCDNALAESFQSANEVAHPVVVLSGPVSR
jgi:hypothetical protein